MVKSNNEKCTVDDLGRWTDEYGRICGWNGYVYLVPGTYELTAEGSGKRGVISAKVTSKTTTLTADVNEFAIDFGNFNDVYAEVTVTHNVVQRYTYTEVIREDRMVRTTNIFSKKLDKFLN